jgi:pimeloyl-ACP methyl ester carboxylesterase
MCITIGSLICSRRYKNQVFSKTILNKNLSGVEMLLSKVRILRCVYFVLSLIIWPAAGIYLAGLSSIIDLIHFSSIPLLISYLLIFRPKFTWKTALYYCIAIVIVTLLVAAYLIAFSKSIPQMRISWSELPIAVYFLLSVYAILWLADKFISLTVTAALRINQGKTDITVKNTIRTGLRYAFVIFVVTPYLMAVFTIHWVKFSDTLDADILPDIEYQQVSFNAKDGTRLNGWFVPSTIRMSDSTVIIAPGRCPTKTLFVPHVRVLNSRNYNVLLLDLRGNGNSSGHKYSFGIKESGDILGAVDYLKNNRPESSKYIFGFGINEGASALIDAASIDERFAGVVIDNPSGYKVVLPGCVANYLPNWMEKILLKVTQLVVSADIGQPAWGTEGLYEKISHISPCPVLVTGSLKNSESNRLQTIEFYARAEEPKMLWLTPAEQKEYQGLGLEQEYFKNILDLFNFGRIKQQSGHWRISQSATDMMSDTSN